jgi:hypothetical protein
MQQVGIEPKFVICIDNSGTEDLQIGKVYQVLADESAARDGYVRVTDDSGEDYLYPADYFVRIVLPQKAERVLLAACSSVPAN